MGAEERLHNNPVYEKEIRDFKNFMKDTRLTELKSIGRIYTWTNCHVHNKIDLAIVNVESWL